MVERPALLAEKIPAAPGAGKRAGGDGGESVMEDERVGDWIFIAALVPCCAQFGWGWGALIALGIGWAVNMTARKP